METLEKYAGGTTLNKFSFAMDSLHPLACFWAREDSLWRCHPKYQIASFVFQDLYSQRDNGVSTMTTRATIHQLYKVVPKNENDAFSSKSLRIVSISKMATHQGVDFFERHACSGHCIGTNK